jgi:hypothetical protein
LLQTPNSQILKSYSQKRARVEILNQQSEISVRETLHSRAMCFWYRTRLQHVPDGSFCTENGATPFIVDDRSVACEGEKFRFIRSLFRSA